MEKKLYISYLNVIAALAVVLLHTNHKFWDYANASYWNTANIIEAVFYFAVPIFFMISGVTLIDYNRRYTIQEYVAKRVERTLIPFLVWSFTGKLYLVIRYRQALPALHLGYVMLFCIGGLWIIALHFVAKPLGFKRIIFQLSAWFSVVYAGLRLIDTQSTSLINVVNRLWQSEYVVIFWFFIPLFAMYICIPILSQIDSNSRQLVFRWGLLVIFFGEFVLRFVIGLIDGLELNGNFQLPLFSGYLWFVVAGYYIDRYPLSERVRRSIYIVGLLGLLIHMIGTFYYSHLDHVVNN